MRTFGFYRSTDFRLLLTYIIAKDSLQKKPVTILAKCNSVIDANRRCYLYVINNHRFYLYVYKKCVDERDDTEH